jgi:hydantoinase/carbamoylase family amidase
MGTPGDPAAALDGARIAARLGALWDIAQARGGGADRPAWSEAEAAGMRLVAGWAAEAGAGLRPALDAQGNLWALPEGDGRVVTSGSHVDTVPGGGRYDGALGTVLALEAAAALGGRAGVLVCAAEEAPRFGAGTLGSRLMTGALPEAALADMRDAGGVDAGSARAAFLAALDDLPRLDGPPPLHRIAGHVEVHIEPRHELRGRGARLGVVERIAAPHRHELVVVGEAGHAGEVAMGDRHDALAAAAELVLALEAAARDAAARAPATVATVGRLDVEPGAISVIPARVRAALEVRGIDADAIATVEVALEDAAAEVAERRGVHVTLRLLRGGDPIALDPGLARRAFDAAAARGLNPVRTYSGAGHDAGHLAAHVPAALLFVPLAGGQSHTPEEAADDDDVLAAGQVLVDVLAAN